MSPCLPLGRSVVVVITSVAASVGIGCGPSAALLRASDTVAVATSAVDDAGEVVTRAEADAPSEAVDRARGGHDRAVVRLRDAEEVLRFWREEGTGKVGWATMAPCLAASLDGLILLLGAANLEVPTELPQSAVVVAEVNGDQCASEPRPEIPSDAPGVAGDHLGGDVGAVDPADPPGEEASAEPAASP